MSEGIGAMIEDFAVALTRTRRGPGTTVAGRHVPDPAPVTTAFTGAVVPASGHQLQRLPENRRSSETVQVFTRTELRVAEAAGVQADLVGYKGKTWEVGSVRDWADQGGFYDVLITRAGA